MLANSQIPVINNNTDCTRGYFAFHREPSNCHPRSNENKSVTMAKFCFFDHCFMVEDDNDTTTYIISKQASAELIYALIDVGCILVLLARIWYSSCTTKIESWLILA